MTKKNIYMQLAITVGCILVTSLFFWFHPAVDIAVSHFFFHKKSFLLLSYPFVSIVPTIITKLIVIFMVGLLLLTLLSLLISRIKKYHQNVVFLLLCFLVAPVLIVNLGLKSHWGRPRPEAVSIFNGTHDYQKVWVISKACDRNCSFVCGDCAAMFCFIAFAFIVRRKKLVATIVMTQAAFFSFLRLGLGKHFLSDILLAWQLDYLVILLVYYLVFIKFDNKYQELLS